MDHNKQQEQQPELEPGRDVLRDRIEGVFVWMFGGHGPTHTPRPGRSTDTQRRGGDRT